MNFRRTLSFGRIAGKDLARGFLDDSIIVSYGIGDFSSHFVEVLARDLLEGHEICQELR